MIKITSEMYKKAMSESKRRSEYINHHFEVKHFTGAERDVIGFLGEFAACQLLGLDWKDNIRNDYITTDSGDIVINNLIIDVKTETLPPSKLKKILNGKITDDETYGRRLISEYQIDLLKEYDLVLFGGFSRDNLNQWYPFGCLDTKHILNNYEITKTRPDGGIYPVAALPVRTSSLRSISNLLKK